MQRNEAFFTTHEAYFLTLKALKGEEIALDIMKRVMRRNLDSAYSSMLFTKGNPEDFARVVSKRDKSVGLHVEFPAVTDDRIVYQFHTDPFPGLKGYIEPEKLDATYMEFKVLHLLGDDWHYTTTKHLWKGDDCTEHVIEKI